MSDSCGMKRTTESRYLRVELNEAAAVPLTRTVAPTREPGTTFVRSGMNARKRVEPHFNSNLIRLFTMRDCPAEMTTPDSSMRRPSAAPEVNCSSEIGVASGRGDVPTFFQ